MELELSNIQGIVITGYGSLTATRYLFLTIEAPITAREWLSGLAARITTETRRQKGSAGPNTVVNVALTYDGLQALGVPADSLETFPPEFIDGMAKRASMLGDTGDSAPANWLVGGPHSRTDLLVLLYAESAKALDELNQGLAMPQGLREIYRQDASFSEHEPFGFKDGISQPGLEGSPIAALPGQSVVKAGEFLLGYENEYGETPTMPTIAQSVDRTTYLPGNLSQPDRRDLGRNGSYMVVRKLVQDVANFWNFFEQEAKKEDAPDIGVAKVRLASKCVGRWPSGAPLVLAPNEDKSALGDQSRNNLFDFMTDDQWGFSCPIGSHIRRANPRDSLLPNPLSSLTEMKRHRIIRRGRSFGAPLAQGSAQPATSDSEQGLMFVALNADFEQQFEFIQRNWINGTAFGGLFSEKDPILGDGGHVFTIPERPVRRSINDIPRFVTTRGGGYFFLPGINALKFLAALT
jgi:Dyp-type peroxidase family